MKEYLHLKMEQGLWELQAKWLGEWGSMEVMEEGRCKEKMSQLRLIHWQVLIRGLQMGISGKEAG